MGRLLDNGPSLANAGAGAGAAAASKIILSRDELMQITNCVHARMYNHQLTRHDQELCNALLPRTDRYITVDMLVELMMEFLSTVNAKLRGGILTEGTVETAFYIRDDDHITYERQVRRPDKICLLCYNL
jgi:hypothetical protein